MPTIIRPQLSGADRRVAVVASEFNEDITKRLADAAVETLRRNGVRDGDITLAWVPGAFELPLAARALAESEDYDAIVCVGAVIRGETRHHLYVEGEAARGIADVARDTGVPCAFGVITAETRAQAEARSGREANRGAEAAEAALGMANLLDELE